MQFYHLVKVLLALHNPHRPSGIGFLQFARAIEVSRFWIYIELIILI